MTSTTVCTHCEIEFDPEDKLRQAKMLGRQPGKVNECLDCATPGPQRFTGVMIYGHKTAGSIQINKDPRLTEYMLASSPSAGTRVAMVQCAPKVEPGASVHVEKDIARRR